MILSTDRCWTFSRGREVRTRSQVWHRSPPCSDTYWMWRQSSCSTSRRSRMWMRCCSSSKQHQGIPCRTDIWSRDATMFHSCLCPLDWSSSSSPSTQWMRSEVTFICRNTIKKLAEAPFNQIGIFILIFLWFNCQWKILTPENNIILSYSFRKITVEFFFSCFNLQIAVYVICLALILWESNFFFYNHKFSLLVVSY